MTERERDMELLGALLEHSDQPGGAAAAHDQLLTRGEERRLLQEANDVAPPTLAPIGSEAGSPTPAAGIDVKRAGMPASFGAEVVEIVRRHPIAALLLSIGVALVLGRRSLPRS